MKKTFSSEEYSRLGEIFKEKRLSLGLSMRDLGGILGEPHSIVQKVEGGTKSIDIGLYVKYCSALKLNPCTVLKSLID